ncbi:MAG: phosphoribosyltransferase family protein [Sulfolobales archaeon]
MEILIYEGQEFYIVRIFGIERKLPLVPIDNDIWIASDAELVLGDVEFISIAGREVARYVEKYRPDYLVVAEAKAIAIAYEAAKNLGHTRFIVARKGIKGYMRGFMVEKVRSITTKDIQMLVLTSDDAELIKGKRVCLFDDVVSTGNTIDALEKLVKRAGGHVACKISIWREGPWYKAPDLKYFDILPIFVSKERYEAFTKEAQRASVKPLD